MLAYWIIKNLKYKIKFDYREVIKLAYSLKIYNIKTLKFEKEELYSFLFKEIIRSLYACNIYL